MGRNRGRGNRVTRGTSYSLVQTLVAGSFSPKVIHLLLGKHGGILGRLEVGWGKVA